FAPRVSQGLTSASKLTRPLCRLYVACSMTPGLFNKPYEPKNFIFSLPPLKDRLWFWLSLRWNTSSTQSVFGYFNGSFPSFARHKSIISCEKIGLALGSPFLYPSFINSI